MRRSFVCSILCVLLAGCAPIDAPKRTAPPKPAPDVTESPVTLAARTAFKLRDVDYADQLNALADDVDGGNVKFDSKLKQRLDEARQHAGEAGNVELSKLIAAEFGDNALSNPGKVSKSLRDMAKALK